MSFAASLIGVAEEGAVSASGSAMPSWAADFRGGRGAISFLRSDFINALLLDMAVSDLGFGAELVFRHRFRRWLQRLGDRFGAGSLSGWRSCGVGDLRRCLASGDLNRSPPRPPSLH